MFAPTIRPVHILEGASPTPSPYFEFSRGPLVTMFGALNRFIGRLDGEPVQQPRNGPSDSAFGFQVLRNKDAELPLEPWFDFIVGINGHTIVRKHGIYN